jgi:Cys-tRNA(Pro)/Cys-tRNA(Cys) deacylase
VSKKTDAAGTPATAALSTAGIRFTPHRYPHDPAAANFGLEAAEKLQLDPSLVFKTLLVQVDGAHADGTLVDGALVVGVVPVTGQLDLKALASAVGVKKASLADPSVAERKTGYVVGGISPVGQKTPLVTVVDASALAHDTIFVSGGRRGFDIELTPQDLQRATGAIFAPIARPASAKAGASIAPAVSRQRPR